MRTDRRWLLLHGTPLTPEVWDGVVPFLQASGRVLAPPLPRPAGPERAQAEVARRVLESLGDDSGPLHVVGHSYGGQVALEVALAAPDRVASLTIVCSRATPFPAFADTAAVLRRGGPVDVEASVARWFLPDEVATGGPVVRYVRERLVAADRDAWADDLEAIAGYDRLAALRSIEATTRVIAAEHDRVGTPDAMREIASAIPGAHLLVVPGASHMSQFLQPSVLASRLRGVRLAS